jgi:hypothetical protein
LRNSCTDGSTYFTLTKQNMFSKLLLTLGLTALLSSCGRANEKEAVADSAPLSYEMAPPPPSDKSIRFTPAATKSDEAPDLAEVADQSLLQQRRARTANGNKKRPLEYAPTVLEPYSPRWLPLAQ